MADKIQRKSGGIADGEQGPPWHFENIFSPTGTGTEEYNLQKESKFAQFRAIFSQLEVFTFEW